MGRIPIKVTNLGRDKTEIDRALATCRANHRRRPRLSHTGSPPIAEILDEWEVVPVETWAAWGLQFGE